MEFFHNFPFFSIILSMVCATISSILPARYARRLTFGLVSAVFFLSVGTLLYVLRTGESFVFLMGHFPAPWGNEIRAGVLEAVMAITFSVVMFLSLLGGQGMLREQIEESRQNLYCIMVDLLMAALLSEVYTNDLFTAYVFVEIMTLTACALIMIRQNGHTLVAAVRYMIMNLVGSGLILIGITLLYGITGHLLMENIQRSIALLVQTGDYHLPLTVAIALLCVGVAIKSALFPFHTWLPDAYGYSTPASSAMLSSLVSKGYIFLLIKIFYRVIGLDSVLAGTARIFDVLFIFGLLGIVLGSILAIREHDIRRMIAYSSVAQIGYIYAAFSLGTTAGFVAAIFQMISHAFSKSMLFIACSGLSEASGGSKRFRDLRSSAYRNPWAGVAFALGAMSMVGIPLLGGFIVKYYISSAAISYGGTHMILLVGALAVSTVLNTIYFLRTVMNIYNPHPAVADFPPYKAPLSFKIAMGVFALANIVLGVYSGPIISAITSGLSMFA